MANLQKISVALSSELLNAVNLAVEGGEYASVSEVIRDALREWKFRQPMRQAELERLRLAWKEGIESGPFVPFDIEAILEKAHSRIRKAS